MKKSILSKFTKIMYILFAILTIIVLFSAYNNIDNKFIVKIAIAYVIFACIFLIYIAAIFILRIKKLKWTEIRKRLLHFSTTFIGIWVANILFTYLIKNEVNILNHIYTPLALAFGISFFDLLWENINE
ncbi:DUF4134 domain-containing protein [Clostridium botulinum]|uniref:hypothetical protein n=1 Tax=unclassified Clostridium TaxID=2614128 RepID=UPI00050568F4|nr:MULTISPECIES: hypothetical protein [unclassified Clostridium]AIY81799.1 putative membrane protein [Clostridium botulinum 202F]KAI3347808.1 hypothetical protein CIT17_06020 [Clostridium botulinum]KFX53988.1 hypothetical protein KU40_18755 [Clostridium botulinum]KFX57021.1 hypothetical protein KU41_11385 [Clostridium botulinum]KON14559.1 hypothetical protein ACP50_03290 [Clostridium botulinum]